MLKHCLIVFLVSMVPVIELRGAIPYGVGFGLPLWLTYCVAIAGNMLPVPAIYFFARRVLVWGSGKPVIGFLAEYDALSGLSQEAGSTEYHELVKGGSGHGCGHNLLGAGAMGAGCTGRCCCSWASHCRAPARGPVRWRPAFWIWTSRRACWPAWAAYCWRGSSWGC